MNFAAHFLKLSDSFFWRGRFRHRYSVEIQNLIAPKDKTLRVLASDTPSLRFGECVSHVSWIGAFMYERRFQSIFVDARRLDVYLQASRAEQISTGFRGGCKDEVGQVCGQFGG